MPPSQSFDHALAKRAQLLDDQTNALRLLDSSGDGFPDAFLETFAGHYLLSTRHPQALTPQLRTALESLRAPILWKHLDQNKKHSPELLFGTAVSAPFPALESGIRYLIDFSAGYSQGIFLDQRLNRLRVRKYSRPGQRILNTFAYTGAFSVAASLGGATTTTLDLSQPYLDWARKNFILNNLDPDNHHFCKGDTFHWLKRFAKQGRRFHGIILDPPTFSRDQKGNVFSVERDYAQLLENALTCLEPQGWILACTNCRKLSIEHFLSNLRSVCPGNKQLTPLPMPPEFTEAPYLKSIWIE
ncbi:MAG: class I SAM-dependent methyltransferase [Verrucomicrobiota bacterium]